MTPHRKTPTLLLSLSLLAGPLAAQLPRDLDAYVTHVMRDFEVPGVAIAVVLDGRVLLAKGYGVRKLGEPTAVDERTLFGIASNTKAFTATALGILVEDGKLRWDAPVIDYLPGFAMYDPFVTRELTIRDLLVHRSGLGLGAGDLLWWPTSTYDRKEIARRLRYIKPATSFRSAYAYDNVLYLVAGSVLIFIAIFATFVEAGKGTFDLPVLGSVSYGAGFQKTFFPFYMVGFGVLGGGGFDPGRLVTFENLSGTNSGTEGHRIWPATDNMAWLFLLGLWTKDVGQRAAFVGLIVGTAAVSAVKFLTDVSYPWYALVGSGTVVVVGLLASRLSGGGSDRGEK